MIIADIHVIKSHLQVTNKKAQTNKAWPELKHGLNDSGKWSFKLRHLKVVLATIRLFNINHTALKSRFIGGRWSIRFWYVMFTPRLKPSTSWNMVCKFLNDYKHLLDLAKDYQIICHTIGFSHLQLPGWIPKLKIICEISLSIIFS